MSPWIPRVLLLAVAALVVWAIYSISVGDEGPTGIEVQGTDETLTFYAGLRQDGARLGAPDAPTEIEVFTDIRSTQGGEFQREVVRPLIEEYVRPERARIVMRHRSLGGAEVSLPAVAATIAGEQGRQWQFAELVMRNLENVGPAGADAEFLRDIAAALRGTTRDFETEEWAARFEPCADEPEAGTECAAEEVPREDDELATQLELPAQPALIVSGPGGTETLLDTPSLAAAREAIERVTTTG